LVLFMVAAGGAGAADHLVVASGMTFTPSLVDVQVGDTVTWENQGGLHNVVAADLSFRCANGCDGQPGGNGNPATNAWSFTLEFNTGRDLAFACEVHAAGGMVGLLQIDGLFGSGLETGDASAWSGVVP
jgi:plastocyanin